MCVDSPAKHEFTVTPSFSLFVDCTTDAQLEDLFAKLSEGGQVMMPSSTTGSAKNSAGYQTALASPGN